jgi:HlyD family secretion protein
MKGRVAPSPKSASAPHLPAREGELPGDVLGVGGIATARTMAGGDEELRTVVVERGTVESRALAIGTIQPEIEVTVKSQVSGVVQRSLVEEGDYVAAGRPLLELRPEPTPLELVEARRALEMRQIAEESLRRERDRVRQLAERNIATGQDLDRVERSYDEAALELVIAEDRLELLETGRVGTGETSLQSEVRAPIEGWVLRKTAEVGDPVVPLSSFQEGTVLMTMADMDRLVFRGTVDEIDVGRLTEGMPAVLRVGALPDHPVPGTLSRIALKAHTEENATVFSVEVSLEPVDGARLRAGFSANAEILLDSREDVLLVPERVVNFEGDDAWVEVPGSDGSRVRRSIRTGLSDAIHVEVLEGLEEGEQVLEKPLRTVG